MGGFCRECFLAEIEEAIAEEHPELKRGDVFELVQEWLRTAEEPLHCWVSRDRRRSGQKGQSDVHHDRCLGTSRNAPIVAPALEAPVHRAVPLTRSHQGLVVLPV